jgi:hypothetical protein
MNPAVPHHQGKRNDSRTWIFRLVLGALVIGVSVWGISLCRQIFRVSIGPDSVSGDSSFANLGTWASWVLFFGPLTIAGVAMVWSTFRKMGALDQFASWFWERAGHPHTLLAKTGQSFGIAPGNEGRDPHGLEGLSTETVERLQRSAVRAATILGALAGAFLLGIGIFGLVSLLLFSGPQAGSSIYVRLATGRITITFVFSGMLVFLGYTILQRTFRRDNNSWLLPLRVFTYIIVRRRAGERTGRAEQRQPGTKQHPRV